MGKREKPITVGFVALGCPKNIVDSEVMLARIGGAGMVISGDIENADVVVINTCGFIQPARDESVEAIRYALLRKKKGKVKKVIAAGCLSERAGAALAEELPGIDAIAGLDRRDNIAEIIKSLMDGRKFEPTGGPGRKPGGGGGIIHDDRGRLLITPRHRAYLRISEGCDRRCSFCTIPAIRGRFRSKDMGMILAEAAELVENGAVELSIIAQDSNYYGRDMGIKAGLSKLLSELQKTEALRWIRIMYLYPAGIDDELIETMASLDKVVHYIDMPVQHINNDMLKAMHRADTKENTIKLVERVRRSMPDAVLRTTVITGFPGESEQQFAELADFIRWARFDALGCFKFYAEDGTAAAKLDGQIPENVKENRREEIMLCQQAIAFEKNRSMVGREIICLVEESGGQAGGRYYGQAPDIDGICHIRKCRGGAGEFVRARVVDTSDYDLVVEQI